MRDETIGRLENLLGRLKAAAGILLGDRKLEREGIRQRAEGADRRSLGEARRMADELTTGTGPRVRRD